MVSFQTGEEKRSLFSAAIFALSVGVLSRSTRQCHSGWLSLQTIQLGCGYTRLGLVAVPFEDDLEVAEAIKSFAPVFVRVTRCALPSLLGFVVGTFILSCASALFFSQSLKSETVGRLQSFLTVCRDQASFMFGGSFFHCLARKFRTRQVVFVLQGAENS